VTPNLDNPKTFSEKIQWIKIYDRNPIFTKLSNKIEVREFVADRISFDVLPKHHFSVNDVSKIDFHKLPTSFVFKAAHGSGMNLICRDIKNLDINMCKRELIAWMKTDYYRCGREWCYKNSRRAIICEELLVDENGQLPIDYKFFCFNGKAKYIQVDVDRFTSHSRVFYDINWEKQDFTLEYPLYEGDVPRPTNLNGMIDVAVRLSSAFSFCRVDLYALPKIRFGEMTFYPGNGQEVFKPIHYDTVLGNYLTISD
jgi:hypothetical protein